MAGVSAKTGCGWPPPTELVAIAKRAARGEDRAELAAQLRDQIEKELNALLAETSTIVTEAAAIQHAHAVTKLEMVQYDVMP